MFTMGISKITRNFQITLPKDVRKQRNFKVGDTLLFVVTDDKTELVKMDKDIIQKTAGLWSTTAETGLQYERRLRSAWQKRQC